MSKLQQTVVLVGVGGFGECWVDAIERYGLRVVAAIDPDAAARARLADRLHLPSEACLDAVERWHGSADLLIDSAPPPSRPRRVLQAVDRVRRIVCAKPVTDDLAALRELRRALGPLDGRVAVAMQKRLLPAFLAMKSLIASERLGEVTYLRLAVELDGMFWRPGIDWRQQLALPSLWEGAIHQIDLAFDWLPNLDPQQVRATAWRPSGSLFAGRSDFDAIIQAREGPVVHLLSRWSVRSPPIVHYFGGVRVDFTGGSAEVRNGQLFIDDLYVPLIDDGAELMDLSALNERLIGRLLSPDAQNEWATWGLRRHEQVLNLVARIADACNEP
jgi:predicted dehydrogenase